MKKFILQLFIHCSLLICITINGSSTESKETYPINIEFRSKTIDVDPEMIEFFAETGVTLKPKSTVYEILGLPNNASSETAHEVLAKIWSITDKGREEFGEEFGQKFENLISEVEDLLTRIDLAEQLGTTELANS